MNGVEPDVAISGVQGAKDERVRQSDMSACGYPTEGFGSTWGFRGGLTAPQKPTRHASFIGLGPTTEPG